MLEWLRKGNAMRNYVISLEYRHTINLSNYSKLPFMLHCLNANPQIPVPLATISQDHLSHYGSNSSVVCYGPMNPEL